MWKDLRRTIVDNKYNISNKSRAAIKIAWKLVKSANSLLTNENKNIISYIEFGLNCIEVVQEHPRYSAYFENKGYTTLETRELNALIYNIIKVQIGNKINKIGNVKVAESSFHTLLEVPLSKDISIGIAAFEDGNVYKLYFMSDKVDETWDLLSLLVWNHYGISNKHINISTINEDYDSNIIATVDNSGKTSIITNNTIKYSNHIKMFLDKNIGRSIIFYGPPGTGKSNLVSGIKDIMNMTAIKISNIDNMNGVLVNNIIKLFSPDLVIIDDIDHLNISDMQDFLSKIEEFNNNGKCILATANEISMVNDALIRPGRFDELIEINESEPDEIRKLVNNDEDIFDVVKDYPIAFIAEVMKRVNVLGKEKTLSNMDDIVKRLGRISGKSYKI